MQSHNLINAFAHKIVIKQDTEYIFSLPARVIHVQYVEQFGEMRLAVAVFLVKQANLPFP
jgi:hypothetical protein